MGLRKTVFGRSKKKKLFIDEQPYQAFYAFSLRRLTKTYLGSCIKVRRSSDNSELDIGFSGDIIDVSAVLSFVGSYDGYVSVWYDQSGHSRNNIQTVFSSQPQIVSSGSVILENSLPTIRFTTSNSMNQPNSNSINECCVFYTASIKTGSSSYYGVARHIPSSGYGFGLFTSNGVINPGIIPFNNGSTNTNLYQINAGGDSLPTLLTVRGFSLVRYPTVYDVIASKNQRIDVAIPNEVGWGSYSTSGLNMGYNGASANMNLSEYVVFENANRAYFSMLVENSTVFYNI